MIKKLFFCLFLCSCSQAIDPKVSGAFAKQAEINSAFVKAHNIVEQRVSAIEKKLGIQQEEKKETKK